MIMGWRKVKLGDVAEFINGRAFKTSEWSETGLPIVRIQNLNDPSKPFNYYSGEFSPAHFIQDSEILLSWSGTPGTSFGCFSWDRGDALLNQHIFKVLIDDSICDKEYFIRAVNQNLRILIDSAHGGVGLKHITKKKLIDIDLPLPPLPVQKRIAAILDAADAYRQKTKALIEKYDQLTQSLFLEMFGDVEDNIKFPISTVGEVTTAVKDGPHTSPKYSEDGVPILSTRNIRPFQLILDDTKYVTSETFDELTKRFKPQKNDILLTKGGTTGLAKLVDWDWEFCIWVHLAALRPRKDAVLPKYLEAALNTHYCYQQSQKYTRGIANRDLGLTRMVKIKLPLPPLTLQGQFEKKVSLIELQKGKLNLSLKKSDELFQSLLQLAFKGELVN